MAVSPMASETVGYECVVAREGRADLHVGGTVIPIETLTKGRGGCSRMSHLLSEHLTLGGVGDGSGGWVGNDAEHPLHASGAGGAGKQDVILGDGCALQQCHQRRSSTTVAVRVTVAEAEAVGG